MSSETQRSLPRTIAKLALNHRGYRKAWPRERFFLRAKRHTPVVAVDTGGARYFVSTSDEAVGLGIFAHGSHERDQLEAVSAVLADWSGAAEPLARQAVSSTSAPTSAHRWSRRWSRSAARAAGRSSRIPGNFKLLRHNLLENGLDGKVEALEMAVSDADGTATLEVAKVNMGDHRVRVGDAGGGRMAEGERETIDVPMRSLDSLVADGTVSLDDVALAWVDTQGHEAHVLAGATCLAEARVPAYIEYWPYALESALEALTGSTTSSRGLGARWRTSALGTSDAKRRPAGEIEADRGELRRHGPPRGDEPAAAAALSRSFGAFATA